MTKSFKIISIIFLLLFSSIPLLHAEPLKDEFYTQGQEVLNAPPIHGLQENVDLFSGNLNLIHTDAHFPGNGGLNLILMRRYNSAIWGRRDVTPTLVENLNQSPLGMGWSMHMGIVRNPYGTGSGDNVYLSNDPILEMPDGSQHALFVDKNDPTRFISKDYWIYKSNGVPGQWTLTLTDGTVYTFEFSQLQTKAGYYAYTIGSGTSTQIAQVIKIENAAKTAAITITYDKTIAQGSSYLKTITDSVGRIITFNYNASHQLASISFDYKTLITYRYQNVTGSPSYGTFSILSEAAPPVGPSWKYSYNNIYELQTLTYPTGGTITYQYSDVPFYIRPYDSTPHALVSFSIVTQRTIQNDGTSGTWTYNYVTGSSSTSQVNNVTTVIAPDGVSEVHRFNGWGNCSGGTVYAVG